MAEAAPKVFNQDVEVHTFLKSFVHQDPQPTYVGGPQPQMAGPTPSRGDYVAQQPAPARSSGMGFGNALAIVLVVAIGLAVGSMLYQNRIMLWPTWFAAPMNTELRTSDTPKNEELPKTEDRIVAESSFARQPATAPQQVAEAPQPAARSNPTKEKYLADCAAAGAPVVQMPDGRLNCKVASSVTFERGTPIAALQNAKTRAEYKQTCLGIRGANYWEEDNGKPHCNRQ